MPSTFRYCIDYISSSVETLKIIAMAKKRIQQVIAEFFFYNHILLVE
jgi:hypothetical protein